MKALFFDIDGTLVNHKESYSKKTVYALEKLKENGHKIFICTGRNYYTAKKFLDFGFDGAIVSAGAYVEANQVKIYENSLSKEELDHVRNLLSVHHILYSLETNTGKYVGSDMLKAELAFFNKGKSNSEIDRMYHTMKDQKEVFTLEQYQGDAVKTILYLGNIQDCKDIRELLSDSYDVVVYPAFDEYSVNGEIMKKGVDKGTGILKILEYYHIPAEDSIGFGDTMGDYSMIQTCHLGIAMGNGDDRLKAVSDRVIESVDDDGIYHELVRLKLIEPINP